MHCLCSAITKLGIRKQDSFYIKTILTLTWLTELLRLLSNTNSKKFTLQFRSKARCHVVDFFFSNV